MSLVTYEIICPRCEHLRIFPTETEFEIMVGANVKNKIDQGFSSFSSSSSDSLSRIRCPKCGDDFAVTSTNVVKKIHTSSSNGAGNNNNSKKPTDDDSAEAQIKNVLDEEIRSYKELDPLMLALEKSKTTNVAVDLEDLSQLLGKFRFLIAPVHSFLRVFVCKNIAEHHIIGNVSFYLLPRAAAGKSSSSVCFQFYSKLFPLAFSPDLPLALVPLGGTCFALLSNFFISSHFCLLLEKVQALNTLYQIQQLSILVAIFGILSMVLMFRTIIREPGYLIPKNKELYFENENDSILSSSSSSSSASNVVSLMLSNTHNNNIKSSSSPSFCSMCQINRPPRASHCRTNHLCICEKDHHCVVIGTAIGRRNILFFTLFLLVALCGSLLNCIQMCWFVYEFSSLITTLGWLSLICNLAVVGNFVHFTVKWSQIIVGGVLKGLNTSEQNKMIDANNGKNKNGNDQENGGINNNNHESVAIVTAVAGTPWSRLVNFVTRPVPPSIYSLLAENNNNQNEQDV